MNISRYILVFITISVNYSVGISMSYSYLKYFKKVAIDIIDKAGPKDNCSRHLKAMITDLFNIRKIWALQMLDASAKIPSGFLSGNIIQMGSFDQCLRIRVDTERDGVIEGQYCTVVLSPAKNSSRDIAHVLDFVNFLTEVMGVEEGHELKHIIKLFKSMLGVCFPTSCSADSMQKLWDYVEYTFRLPIHVALNQNYCSRKNESPFEFHFDGYIIWAFVIYFTGMCVASLYDIVVCMKFKEYKQKRWEQAVTSFSVFKNAKSIFNYNSSGYFSRSLDCISGLKVLSMLWVIYGHRYALGYLSGTTNMLDHFEWRKSVPALIVLLAPFAVDTFLSISGLLLAYKYMEVKEILPKDKPFPYVMFYFFRILRLWPALIATLLFMTSVMKYLNDGPLWTLAMSKISLTCSNTAWITVLFLTNLVKISCQCLEQAWYLAVDTQLYCVGPFFLYFMYKYPKSATLSYIALCFISGSYAYVVTVNNKQKWSPSEGDDTYHLVLYQSTFVRMPSWIIGIIAGTFLYNFRQIKISKVLVIFIWLCLLMILFIIAKATNLMIRGPYNEYASGMYNALARPIWSMAICILIFLCATGNGGIVNKILSWKIFKIAVKLSYSTFLLHIAAITLIAGQKRTATYHSTFITVHAFLGDLPFIFGASLLWCLAFESPFINIAKIMTNMEKGRMKAITAGKEKKLSKHFIERDLGAQNISIYKKYK